MAIQNLGTPKGTRDFTPEVMLRRNFIFDTIKEVFRLFGFMPLETPAMENLSTLTGKYGEEGDKLIFKILNSGDFLSEVTPELLAEKKLPALASRMCEKGLRYDLTVPFARFVAQHHNELTYPFKRYQIQPVWRADRPQKGRYREFYQCDADTVGSTSLLNELEYLQIIDMVFKRLDIPVCIKINNRKILTGIAEAIGASEKLTDMTVAIDKLEKIGIDKVKEELAERGFSNGSIAQLQQMLLLQGSTTEKTGALTEMLKGSDSGIQGIAELNELFALTANVSLSNEIEFDVTLARGLSYYTGTIIEVKAKDVPIGSICAGGRYDNLTGIFGLPDVSGVGISFGADRIFDVLVHKNAFPKVLASVTQVMFVNFDKKTEAYCIPIVAQLRAHGVHCELYPEAVKIKKQFSYADAKGIQHVALIGEDEMKEDKITVKDMSAGTQQKYSIEELLVLCRAQKTK